MKVALHLVEARRDRLAGLLKRHRYLPLRQLCRRLKVSEATARRDLTALVKAKRITRTYGGALSDFSNTFASFAERQIKAETAKKRIAETALRFLEPGMVCYIDAGTTMLYLADALRQRPVSSVIIVTNNLPVAETLAEVEGLEVHLIGGLMLGRQSVLLGDKACQGARQWKFDLAFLGAEGMTPRGLFNSQQDVVRYQRIVAARAERVAFCLDATKLGHEAAHFLLAWQRVDLLLTDASFKTLKDNGVTLNHDQLGALDRDENPNPALEESSLEDLLRLSHELGLESRGMAILGEGNTSARRDDETFWVKASGTNLATLKPEQVVVCRFDKVLAMMERKAMTDAEVHRALLDCRTDPDALKPSVEALFHGFLLGLPEVNFVGHVHAVAVNQILCSPRAKEFAEKRIFPDEIVCCGAESVLVPYTDPGLILAQAIRERTLHYMEKWGDYPRLILLENHGVIALGSTYQSVLAALLMAEKTAQIWIGAAALGGPVFLSEENVQRIAQRPDEHYRQTGP